VNLVLDNGTEPGTLRLGAILFRFESVSSTNDIAKRLARKGLPEGTVVLAKIQEKGRGRRDRRWVSPLGGLWFSILLRPRVPLSCMPLIPIAAGVSTARTIRRLFRLDVVLKWPNDVMAGARKIAGILTESSASVDDCYVIVGFGINANNSCASMPPQLRNEMISLSDLLRSEVNVEWLMQENLNEFAEVYGKILANDSADVVEEWKQLTDMLRQPILVYEDEAFFQATAVDLDSDGALLIRTEDGTLRRLLSANISIRRVKQRS
jgi:BirA family biotin operon repressor/biotin-[acetyl-CoA-carboxylase] ligase